MDFAASRLVSYLVCVFGREVGHHVGLGDPPPQLSYHKATCAKHWTASCVFHQTPGALHPGLW